jgi:alkylhydroperoxidase/carboxymuconolactone decarboxylase family protein YurZ
MAGLCVIYAPNAVTGALYPTLIQTAPYGGFPRALNALGALSDVLSEVA